jgi:rhodanese-related sulfurtransferase
VNVNSPSLALPAPFAGHDCIFLRALRRSLCIACLLIIAGWAASARAADPVLITPEAACSWIDSDASIQILDVRSREEFESGHISKSRRIGWPDKAFADSAKKALDPSKPVLVYCQSGRRSAKAAAELVKLGFKDIRDLQGGVNQWTKAGRPLVKTEQKQSP